MVDQAAESKYGAAGTNELLMRPLMIGVAGGSGSGKTTVARRIAEALPPAGVTILEHDAYYRDRGDISYEERCGLNFDHPESLETELLVEHLAALRRGESIDVPRYDFKTHRRAPDWRRVAPTPVVIVEGILVFVEAKLREQLDIKIYVDTDADIRAFRRIRRDIEHRGRTFESVREQYYRTVRPMHLMFVEPSKRWADVIIPEGGDNKIGIDLVIALIRQMRGAEMAG
ncbi:uridine kinase [Polyangium sp. y55x31]|uniref:uridine kinase n=1 Tax=Polyangium sp. y55x31 TaxID=3042688 RepID=UPI002482D66E|nr:uridine kinase [Polyangium sp. y55x31]MDI1475306.1 uridine kinase [Polyangium sp. y55x31]